MNRTHPITSSREKLIKHFKTQNNQSQAISTETIRLKITTFNKSQNYLSIYNIAKYLIQHIQYSNKKRTPKSNGLSPENKFRLKLFQLNKNPKKNTSPLINSFTIML